MARILIADDHLEARRGARELLEAHPGWEVCGEACDGMEAIEKAAARVIRSTAPNLPLLLFSLYAGDAQMSEGFRKAGFTGDVNKAAADQLIEAVETLLQGGTYFQSASLAAAIINDDADTIVQPTPAPVASSTPATAPPTEAAPQASATAPSNSLADDSPLTPPAALPGDGAQQC